MTVLSKKSGIILYLVVIVAVCAFSFGLVGLLSGLPDKHLLLSSAYIQGDRALMTVSSDILPIVVSRFWSDMQYLLASSNIRQVTIFMMSPGGDAFSGIAMSEQIEKFRRLGMVFDVYASGVIASAALPIFSACTNRVASLKTMFMIHKAYSDRNSESQEIALNMINERYAFILSNHSFLDEKEWSKMQSLSMWFGAEEAKEYGIVDYIESGVAECQKICQ